MWPSHQRQQACTMTEQIQLSLCGLLADNDNQPSEAVFFTTTPRRTPVHPCTLEASVDNRVQSAPVLL